MRLKARHAALAAGTALVAITAHLAAGAALRHGAEARLAGLAGPGLTVTHGAIDADPWSGRVTVRGVGLDAGQGRSLSIGAIRLDGTSALVTPAFAAGDVVLENIVLTWSNLSYTIPRLQVVGSSLGEADVRDFFNMAAGSPLSGRLARLSAESVVIPELRATSTAPDVKANFIYKDLRLVGIDQGIVRSMAASGGVFSSEDKSGDIVTGSVGPMTATQIDLPWIVKSYTEPAGPGDTALKTAYAGFTIDSLTGAVQANGKETVKFTFGRMAGKDFKLRPTKEPWLPFVQELSQRPEEERKNLPPAERVRLVNLIADMAEAVQVGSIEMTNITFAGTAEKSDATVTISRFGYVGADVGRPSDARVEGFEVKATDGGMRIGTLAQTGFSIRNTLEGLRKTVGREDFDPQTVDPRMFIPEIGTFTLRDMDFNVPDAAAKAKNPSAPNVRIGLKGFELQATEPLNGIPTVLRTAVDRLSMALPANSTEDGIKDLLALGYKDIDVSFGLDARWRETDSDLTVNTVNVQGVNMGSLGVSGVLGNVARDIFTGDSLTAQFALMGATVKTVKVAVENKGLFERVLEREAKRMKKTPDQLRKELSSGAQMIIPAFLGPAPGTKAVLTAVQSFIAKPGRLTLTATAKDPSGLGAADLMMASGRPQALLAKVDLTATAD